MEEKKNVCPCCDRHCELSAPSCERGEEYARTGVIPERGRHGGHEGHGGHGRFEGRGGHEHHDCHGGHGGEREKHGRRRELRSILESERYEAMDMDNKLTVMLRELRHLGRMGFDSKGGQGRVMRMLSQDGPMKQRELTERLGIQPGSASEVLGKLERAGLITRSQSETDRRSVDIALTEAGKTRAEEVALERAAQVHEMFSVLTQEEKASFLAVMEKLNRAWFERGKKCRRGEPEA